MTDYRKLKRDSCRDVRDIWSMPEHVAWRALMTDLAKSIELGEQGRHREAFYSTVRAFNVALVLREVGRQEALFNSDLYIESGVHPE